MWVTHCPVCAVDRSDPHRGCSRLYERASANCPVVAESSRCPARGGTQTTVEGSHRGSHVRLQWGQPQSLGLGFNVAVVMSPRKWPVSLTVEGSYSSSSRNRPGYEETASTTEFGAGVRKTFGGPAMHAFAGAGLALGGVNVADHFAGGDETFVGAGSGGFIEAGAFVRARSMVDLGLIFRFSSLWSDWFPVEKGALLERWRLFWRCHRRTRSVKMAGEAELPHRVVLPVVDALIVGNRIRPAIQFPLSLVPKDKRSRPVGRAKIDTDPETGGSR